MSVIRTFTMEATSFFPRFVRAFPTESCDLYLNIVSMIADPTARLDSEMTLRVEQKLTLVQTHVHLLVLFSTLLDHLPLGIELPILAPNLRQGLRDFAFYCERQVDELDSHFIRAVAEGRNDRIPGFRWAPVVVWEACERRVGEFAAVLSLDLLGPSTCLKLAEGEEMMACSRCLAVRYCSRGPSFFRSFFTLRRLTLLRPLTSIEHQRADWKRHKKFCFKPTW
ncbi:hypothetical protein BDY24DRAFT_95632 [Mrakia frigida]|uniref:zinc finger MYND domain-containing protein n=1 Tax=Mrakia frigida TaxID=29902 RepID=UPI003FCC0416